MSVLTWRYPVKTVPSGEGKRSLYAPSNATTATKSISSVSAFWHCARLVCLILLLASPLFAQDIQSSKSGVVRIVNFKLKEQGTGFIVKLTSEEAYIITAAHVVSGSKSHDVYFFGRSIPAEATVLNREEDDLKGLALLVVRAKKEILASVATLELGASINLHGTEAVQTIGFPGGTRIWTSGTGNVKRFEGRSIVVSGDVKNGNSGGPVLLNGLVIGLVTDVMESDQTFFAVLSESLSLYVRGCGVELSSKDTRPNQEAMRHTALGNQHWERAMGLKDWILFDNEMAEALAEYRIAESYQPQNPLFRVNTGTALNRLGRYEEAVVKLREGVKLDPSIAWFHNELCVALKMLKRFEDADPECLKAVKFDNNNSAFQDTLLRFLEGADQARAKRNPNKAGLYRVRVTVVDSTNQVVKDAEVTSAPTGDQKTTSSGSEIDIPDSVIPGDRKLRIWATKDGGILKGFTEVVLSNDYNPAVTVVLNHERSARIKGQVNDEDGNAIIGGSVYIRDYPEETVRTDERGRFDLPAHAASGEFVHLFVEAKGFQSWNDFLPAGGESPTTIVLAKKKRSV